MKFQLASLALGFLSAANAQTSYFVGSGNGLCPGYGDDCTQIIGVPCDSPNVLQLDWSKPTKPIIVAKNSGATPAGSPLDASTCTTEGQGCLQAVWERNVYPGPVTLTECTGRQQQYWWPYSDGTIRAVFAKYKGCLGFDENNVLVTHDCRNDKQAFEARETVFFALSPTPGEQTLRENGEPLMTVDTIDPPAGGGGGGGGDAGGDAGEEGAAGAGGNGGGPPTGTGADLPATVVDVLAASANHTVLVAAVTEAGLADVLMEEGPYTVFAPTDEAFAMAVNETSMYLETEYSSHLADILSYHVAMGKVMSTGLTNGPLEMANGENAVVNRRQSTINGAGIIAADMEAMNGVVHYIDTVLLPEWTSMSILDAVAGMPEMFSTLQGYVVDANLTSVLEGGPFTVFAPTNEAFAAAEAALAGLLEAAEDPTAVLTEILLYHVAPGIFTSDNLEDGDMIDMASGDTTAFTLMEIPSMAEPDVGMVDNATEVVVAAAEPEYMPMINMANITNADYLVNNGVIHEIDSVLLPPSYQSM